MLDTAFADMYLMLSMVIPWPEVLENSHYIADNSESLWSPIITTVVIIT